MVRVLELGDNTKRRKRYRKVDCDGCGAVLAFEEGADAWCDDPQNDIWRIECPICRKKIHFYGAEIVTSQHAVIIDEEEYNNAIQDTSKSGLQMLMAEKKKGGQNQ